MHAATAQPPDLRAARRADAAKKGAAKRRLQSPEDRGVRSWLAAYTDGFDYERVRQGRDGGYYRPPNGVVEASLNGPRHEHLRRLQVDDVRRHRAGEHTLRVIPTHSQRRATAALRIDADAHAGQGDAAGLISFLGERFFRPRGRPLHDEPSDRGHAGYFTFDMTRHPWRGRGGEDLGPRGDGTYVLRAATYNKLFRRVQAALQRIAAHHGFAATVELNGRFTVTARDEPRAVERAADGTVYDARTWDVIDSPRLRQGQGAAGGDDGDAEPFDDTIAGEAATWPFPPTTPGEIPGRVRVVARGSTFRAPRCPHPGDVARLEASRHDEAVLHDMVRYADSLGAVPPSRPPTPPAVVAPAAVGAADRPSPADGQPVPSGTAAGRKRPAPRRVRRPGAAAMDRLACDQASNPFDRVFLASRHAAITSGHLGGECRDFDQLPEHEQDRMIAAAMDLGPSGTEEDYRRALRKVFRTYDPRPGSGGGAGRGGLWADERVDFPRAEQLVRSTVSRDVIGQAKRRPADGGRSPVRGRLDYDTIAIALICLILNANKAGVRRDGGRVKLDHCPTAAVINWMAYFGHSVNGSWVAAAIRLLTRAGLVACVTRKYVPGKFARRYAILGAARRLPFVAHLYADPKPEPAARAGRTAQERYRTDASFSLTMAGPGREKELFPEGMKGHVALGAATPGASWPVPFADWLTRQTESAATRESAPRSVQ